MDRLYFHLVRVCAQHCFSRYTFRPIPPEHWSCLLKEIDAINYGRLLSFYAYLDQCNVTHTEQYEFHRTLCVTYPSHYPSLWWMFWQTIKSMWSNVSCQFNSTMGNITSRLCANSTPTLALNDIFERMRCLVAGCGIEVHIDVRDAADEYQNDTREQEEEEDDEQPDEATFRENAL